MDAPTKVALLLGLGGFVLSGVTLFFNRRDSREGRWLQERRHIYATAQVALTAYFEASLEANSAREWAKGIEGDEERAQKRREAEALVSKIEPLWQPIEAVTADLDLLAPPKVVAAFLKARSAVLLHGFTVQYPVTPTPPAWENVFSDAVRECARSLNAMRADLGLGPVDRYAAASGEDRARMERRPSTL
ncbi:MAG: hypothetical protein HGA44_16970 [Cellulomonadaceae bacterium]|nr:hypothetical protein [Cellulomonadaceae bacterium]